MEDGFVVLNEPGEEITTGEVVLVKPNPKPQKLCAKPQKLV